MAVIRPEAAADATLIDALLRSAFPTVAESRLVTALRTTERLTISLVAEEPNGIVGHIAFSPVRLEGANGCLKLLGLAPVAVQPELQRSRIGSALIEHGLIRCRAMAVDAVVVLGEPAFYHRFGFRRASDCGISNIYGVDDEFMIVELRAGSLADAKGTAQYSPEFADL